MSTEIEGMAELLRGLKGLPDNIRSRVLRAWTRKWSGIALSAALKAAPVGKTRNLLAGIVRRDTSRAVLRKLDSLARSVVIGKRPAYHFHLVNLGTKPRWTGSKRAKRSKKRGGGFYQKKTGNARAFRGIMPKNPFIAQAAKPLMARAEQDLKEQVAKNLAKFLKSGGGGSPL